MDANNCIRVMIDCSRGSVPTVRTILKILRLLALNGLNTLQLYTEDTYEVNIHMELSESANQQ